MKKAWSCGTLRSDTTSRWGASGLGGCHPWSFRGSVCQAGRCCCQDLIGLVAGSISAGPTVLGERANETKIDRGHSPRVDHGHGEARDRERRDGARD